MNSVLNKVAGLGTTVIEKLLHLGYAMRMFWAMLLQFKVWFTRTRLVMRQIHFLGNYSLVIMVVSAAFIGAVLALQAYYALSKVGSEAATGVMVTLSLIRELSPVVVAILFAGRAGTSMTAEIGLMKSGEQLAAMEMMGVDPIEREYAPRFWAGGLVVPMLTMIFSLVGIYGGYLVAVRWLGVDAGVFWNMIHENVDVSHDIFRGSFVKSVVFGLAVSFIAVYEGAQSHPTPEGVAKATTRTVVKSSLLVLALDFVLTALMFSPQN
ncbi:MAG: lipid asymmetry maintenance ABC transporter permease subunit MlaE [Hydromonas sp.]|jgi:phospholipid/cholesterol/gamma-HCH transport system permease protein|nr:lipid asymmetry maintenance ABC transporter permease subunit MlaE [Hydromonas sp.]MBP6294659.1 lipid asymmetry maintenance ABC transporter permease subunit MlaE [Hydromonas sp.]